MQPREVIPRTRSYTAAAGAFIASAGVVALAVGILVDTQLPAIVQVATLGVGALFSLAMLVIALRLASGRGGLVADPEGARLGVGVTSERDTWWIPRADVVGLRVVAEARAGETIEKWLAVVNLRDRADLVLARSDDRGTIVRVARQLATAMELPELDAEAAPAALEAPEAEGPAEPEVRPEAPAPAPASVMGPSVTVDFGVRRRAALQGILFFFGTSLGVVGVGMFTRVAHDPVFGFLFGPLLGLLGLTLLALTFAKRFATEELRREGDHFAHSYRVGPLRWGARRVHAPEPRWHLFIHGMRGAHLELVGTDGILVLGGGATTRSAMSLAALAALPARFAPGR